MRKLVTSLLAIGCVFAVATASATIKIKMYRTAAKGQGESIGTITAKDTPYGLLLTPNLKGLAEGIHGFHVHQNPNCDDNGMAAGGHLDPANTDKHLGPYTDKGHLGDMPPLYFDKNMKATLPVLAPRLKEADLKNHSLMIHVGGDNYSDRPAMGGGGARAACGVVE